MGMTFGTVCALRRGKWIDTVLTVIANIGITIPSFFVGIILIYIFTYKLGWLRPPLGYVSPFHRFRDQYSADNFAGVCTFYLSDCFPDPPDAVLYAGGYSAGLHPHCLGQGLAWKD